MTDSDHIRRISVEDHCKYWYLETLALQQSSQVFGELHYVMTSVPDTSVLGKLTFIVLDGIAEPLLSSFSTSQLGKVTFAQNVGKMGGFHLGDSDGRTN